MPTSASSLYIGLMSGTSMDGVDGVICQFQQSASNGLALSIITHAHRPFTNDTRTQLLNLQYSQIGELHQSAILSNQLADVYANLVNTLLDQAQLSPSNIRAIGCHGQTIRHRPDEGYTLQIGNHARLAEKTGIAAIGDFRSRDIAAGGQGAPLVPAFHYAYFAHPDQAVTVVNIGGMANLSRLSPGEKVIGFDCGPGNVFMDAWIQLHQNKPYDDNGQWAASGTVIPKLLDTLLAHSYFAKAPPKSCGREEFDLVYLQSVLKQKSTTTRAHDVQATLLELTARCITLAIDKYCPNTKRILICGGGAKNTRLLARIKSLSPKSAIHTTTEFGLDADLVEAAAFAWLAYRHVEQQTGNLPEVTGATGARILGAYYPA